MDTAPRFPPITRCGVPTGARVTMPIALSCLPAGEWTYLATNPSHYGILKADAAGRTEYIRPRIIRAGTVTHGTRLKLDPDEQARRNLRASGEFLASALLVDLRAGVKTMWGSRVGADPTRPREDPAPLGRDTWTWPSGITLARCAGEVELTVHKVAGADAVFRNLTIGDAQLGTGPEAADEGSTAHTTAAVTGQAPRTAAQPRAVDELEAAAVRLYDERGDDPPNLVEAEELLRGRLPGATRSRIRKALLKPPIARRRRPAGKLTS